MSIKVIGAGFGRTGTLSLKTALEELGFDKCYHMIELLQNPHQVAYWEQAHRGESVDWPTLFQGYQAIVDFPGYRFTETLMQHYPESKVILTTRDPIAWHESVLATIYKAGPSLWGKIMMSFQLPFSPRLRRMIRIFKLADEVWQQDFQGRFEDRDFALQIFEQHHAHIKQIVPSDRLLVFEVAQGWEPLCQFLEVPVPEGKPFPRTNDRASFGQLNQQLLKGIA